MPIKLDDKGRLIIPKKMREKIGLSAGSEVNIEMKDNSIILTNPNDEDKFVEYLNKMISRCVNEDVEQYLVDILNTYLSIENGDKY